MRTPSRGAVSAAVVQPPWLEQAILPWRVCRQRILVVADGELDFDESSGFGLTEFLGALAASDPFGLHPEIVIAHRDAEAGKASAAMRARFSFFSGFRFVDGTAPHALVRGGERCYDQVWLFGMSAVPIEDDEVRAIARFMQLRGGVFATGDREGLGSGMAARLPRVRKMRDWYGGAVGSGVAPPRLEGPEPAGEGGAAADRPQDGTRRILPHYAMGVPGQWVAHPLLRLGGDSIHDVIDALPDHPHDSECTAGTALGDPYALVSGIPSDEFPAPAGSRARLAPQIVATAVAGGLTAPQGAMRPRCFGAISAYDGHRVGLGRIVCDATWHHFLNINLNGVGASPARMGLRDPFGNPTRAWDKVAHYYRNIASWLGPVRHCRWYIDILVQRFKYPLLEEIVDLPPNPGWTELVATGAKVGAALDATRGRGTAFELVHDALVDLPAAAALAGAPQIDALERYKPALVPAEEFAQGLFGAIAHEVIADLPESAWSLRRKFGGATEPEEIAEAAIRSGLAQGLALAAEHYERAARNTVDLVRALRPARPAVAA